MSQKTKFSDDEIRKMLIEYLTVKHGNDKAEEIIATSEYDYTDKLIPGNPVITIRTKGEKYYRSFMINDGNLSELERVDENSEEGRLLYKNG